MREGMRSYAEWVALAKSLGYEGPYELVGRPRGRQFVLPTGGTAAMWNSEHGVGYVFDPPSPPQQKGGE